LRRLAKWSPGLRLTTYKITAEEAEILVEELAEIIYDEIASLENKSNLVPTESKTNEDNEILERTGSDG
jgi:hypothetical protein